MNPHIIEGEFAVIDDGEQHAPVWTFWGDTAPQVLGVMLATAVAAIARGWIFSLFR